ncbi:hypothetical protein BC828DRAFT_401347 [Blastocladiella britannica]|nr:hypothetical protein BC828DRAFT_401347 [Blastocladiella britannica]
MDTTTTGLLSALTTRLDSIDQSAVLRAAAIAVPVALVSLPLMTIGRMGSKFIDAKRTENALIAAGVPHETEFWHPVWGIGELMAKMSVSKVMAFLTERHGGAVIFRGLHKTSLLVTDPKIAQLIIGKYNLPKGDYSSVEGLLGNSMLTTNGAEWSHKRKAVNPAFRVSFLQNILLPITVDRTGEMFDVMFPNSPAGGSVNLQDLFSKITLDVIGLAGFEYVFFYVILVGSFCD